MTEPLQQCYNKGCGQKFDPKTNNDTACLFHPGPPYFHDAYKIWNCCNRKSTDFTQWLSFEGCTRGQHNPVKPPESEKPIKASEDQCIEEVEVHRDPSTFKLPKAARRNDGATLVSLQRNVRPEVVAAAREKVAERRRRLAEAAAASEHDADSAAGVVQRGTACKNSGCQAVYENSGSLSEECWFHPGGPVFHEGLKYWSCCTKTTTDFDNFLSQEGCTVGRHVWLDKAEKRMEQCRFDWHQTPNELIVTVYAKGAVPDSSDVKATATRLKGAVEYAFGDKLFPVDVQLWGEIDVQRSAVTITPSKLELKLRKGRLVHWPRLAFDAARDADDSAA